MTESEWLTSTDPRVMLTQLGQAGLADEHRLQLFVEACRAEYDETHHHVMDWRVPFKPSLASEWANYQDGHEKTRAALLRDVFGNPWDHGKLAKLRKVGYDTVYVWENGPHWQLTPTVKAIAADIHERQAWELLPILADALEEAGCNVAELLGHLRNDAAQLPLKRFVQYYADGTIADTPILSSGQSIPADGVHSRGCWAVQLCLPENM